jgi:predicted  nucleic acid-binding Zn-ribbon protein
LAVALLAAACGPSRQEFQKALTDAQTASAQKDSVLAEMTETSKLISQINAELAKAKSVGVTPMPKGEAAKTAAAEERAATLSKVAELVARLNDSETRLSQLQARYKTTSKQNATLLAQIETYKQQIADLQSNYDRQLADLGATIDTQKVQIAGLSAHVDTLTAANSTLTVEKTALKDTVNQLTVFQNTVYYVVGTEDELVKKGVAVKEGSKFLFFGGKHLVPARNLTPEQFSRLDMTKDLQISLPDPEKEYKIVSRQSSEFLSPIPQDGKVKGSITIASPKDFWAPSKYLIVAQD